jgi:hypothetical protein
VDLLIVSLLVAAIFGAAGRRVARHYSQPGWAGFLAAALLPPVGLVAAVWALASDLPPPRVPVSTPRSTLPVVETGAAGMHALEHETTGDIPVR